MHVMMLSWEYPPRVVGGLARHVGELARALVVQGLDVSVITTGEGSPSLKIEDGVLVARWPKRCWKLPWLWGTSREDLI